MTTYNQQNPFLNNDVYTACNQARVYYLDMVQRKQQFGGTPINSLEASLQKHRANLDMYREESLRAAFAGHIHSASTQLTYIVMEWGLYKAHQDLIDANGAYLDAADPDTANDFDLAVEHKVVFWATELLNKWGEGDHQRKTDLGNLQMQRQAELFGGYQQVIQSQGSALNQAHQHNKQYADAALHGAQQAQQGAQWMMQGVQAMHQQAGQHVYWMQQGVEHIYSEVQSGMKENLKAQKATTEAIVQNLPREMEKAQAKVERKKVLTRAGCALVLILAVPAALAFAYILLTQVVLH
ncbi:MAG: hypothetical protein H0U76_18645 [Ktedonobacteraceae bacterium]|nr:hypothetical protein [Ktedonobacteraceae bacterium]